MIRKSKMADCNLRLELADSNHGLFRYSISSHATKHGTRGIALILTRPAGLWVQADLLNIFSCQYSVPHTAKYIDIIPPYSLSSSITCGP